MCLMYRAQEGLRELLESDQLGPDSFGEKEQEDS
jgi:hypothetical protein